MPTKVIATLKAVGSFIPSAVMIGILGFMGGGIVENDRLNTSEHTSIRREIVVGDEAVISKVDNVKDIVTDIRLEQRTIIESLKRIEGNNGR